MMHDQKNIKLENDKEAQHKCNETHVIIHR